MSDHARLSVTGPTGAIEFHLSWETTLAELLDRARAQMGLDAAGAELWCADGTTMMNKLGRTLQELRDRRICPRREFVIRV